MAMPVALEALVVYHPIECRLVTHLLFRCSEVALSLTTAHVLKKERTKSPLCIASALLAKAARKRDMASLFEDLESVQQGFDVLVAEFKKKADEFWQGPSLWDQIQAFVHAVDWSVSYPFCDAPGSAVHDAIVVMASEGVYSFKLPICL